MSQEQNLKKTLRNSKLKVTTSRMSVLKTLSAIKRPAAAQEIYKKVGKNKIDLVTLYRILASFEEKGLLRKVNLQKDAVYYELNIDHHHHIVCTNCNVIEDFENSEVEKVLEKISKKSAKFFSITNHSLELFGLCKTCS